MSIIDSPSLPYRTTGPEEYGVEIRDDSGQRWLDAYDGAEAVALLLPDADRLTLAAAIAGDLGTVLAHPEGALPEVRYDKITRTHAGYGTGVATGAFHAVGATEEDEDLLGGIYFRLAVLHARRSHSMPLPVRDPLVERVAEAMHEAACDQIASTSPGFESVAWGAAKDANAEDYRSIRRAEARAAIAAVRAADGA